MAKSTQHSNLTPVIDDLHDEIVRLNELTRQLSGQVQSQGTIPFSLKNELVEDFNQFSIHIDVKEYDPKDIQVKLDDQNYLIVEGKHEQKTSPDEQVITKQFTRKFFLPKGVDEDKIKAKILPNGILAVIAPKAITS